MKSFIFLSLLALSSALNLRTEQTDLSTLSNHIDLTDKTVQENGMSLTIKGDSAANLMQTTATKCTVPWSGIGCYNAVEGFKLAVSELNNLAGGDPDIAAVIGDVAAPIINLAIQAAQDSGGNLGSVGAAFKTGFCLSEEKGSDIVAARPGSVMGDHACNNIAVDPDENFLVISLGLATDIIRPLCPTAVNLGEIASFCMTYSTCNGMPTLGFMISAPIIACAAGNGVVQAATGGASEAVTQVARMGLNQIGFGFSPSASLQYTVKVWDGDNIVDASVNGNYFDYVEVTLDITKILGVKTEFIALTGHQTRIISLFGDVKETVNSLASSSSPGEAIGTIVSNFAAAMEMHVSLTIKLSTITAGALPDTPTLKLASFNALLSTQPKSETGVAQGFYLLCRGIDIVKTLVTEFFTYVIANMAGILDAIFGDGATDGFLKAISPDTSSDTIFALSITGSMFGFYVQVPAAAIILGPLAGDLAGVFTIQCKVKYDGPSFSCQIDWKEPKWLSALIDGVVWVVKEAAQFFENTGKVLVAIAEDAWEEVGKWTKKAIQQTGQEIKDGLIAVGDELSEWAESTGGAFLCGFNVVADAVECGVDHVTDGAVCGFNWVTDAAVCGATYTADGAVCGFDFVTDGAVCGWDAVTDGAICGFDFVTDGAVCGWNHITSAIECGVDVIGSLCSGCSGCSGCGWGGCSGCSGCSGCFNQEAPKSCSTPKSCNVPKSCNIESSCNVPKSCNIANRCQAPKSCDKPKECNIAIPC